MQTHAKHPMSPCLLSQPSDADAHIGGYSCSGSSTSQFPENWKPSVVSSVESVRLRKCRLAVTNYSVSFEVSWKFEEL